MRLRTRRRRRHDPPSVHEAVAAFVQCPPPWQRVDRDEDEAYRSVVAAYGEKLLQRAQARPESRAWLLVRYLPNVPAELVERSLALSKRESTEFCELVGGTPDVDAAEAWEAEWRASRRKVSQRRRAAS